MHTVFEDEERGETPTREVLQLVETRSPPRSIRRKALFADSLLETSGGGRRHGRLFCPSYCSVFWSPFWFWCHCGSRTFCPSSSWSPFW